MRVCLCLSLCLVFLAGGGTALADPADLSNGVFIAHAPSSLQYTNSPPTGSWCGAYAQYAAIDSCSEQINEVDTQGAVVWYVLSAWTESKQWCGAQFGLGDYDADNFVIMDHGPCFPSSGMTIPTSGWPGPNEGIALTTTDENWSGNFVPVYWMAGYVYGEDVIPLGPDPDSDFAGWARCEDQEETAAAALGGLGLLTDGVYACPESDLDGNGMNGADGAVIADIEEDDSSIDEDAFDSSTRTFVQVTAATDSAFVAVARALEREYGLRVLVGLGPDALFCQATEVQRDAVSSDPRVSLVTDGPIPGIPIDPDEAPRSGDPDFTAYVWNMRFVEPPPEPMSDSLETDEPLVGCIVDAEGAGVGLPTHPDKQTSLYMLGDVGVSLLFMESEAEGTCDQGVEDWEHWPNGYIDAYVKIVEGLLKLASLLPDGPGGRLHFWIEPGEALVVPTSDEPIEGPGTFDEQWALDGMTATGFGDGTSAERRRAFVNAKRAQYGFDWYILGYVINNKCLGHEEWGEPGVRHSFANRFGPSMALLTRNDSYHGIARLDDATAHETCHLFGAGDEYEKDIPYVCESLEGYLLVENHNAYGCTQPPGSPQVSCIMNDCWDVDVLCSYTRAGLGWLESDDPPDGICDAIDQPDCGLWLRIGQNQSLDLGAKVDIYDGPRFVKRLASSEWNSDGNQMMWDGIGSSGEAEDPGGYTVNVNGLLYAGTLAEDDGQPPLISDLQVTCEGVSDPTPHYDCQLSFMLGSDTGGARVRAAAFPAAPSQADKFVIEDEFRLALSDRPVTQAFDLQTTDEGEWSMVVQACDVGLNPATSATVSFCCGSASVVERRANVPVMPLLRGHPNPSGTCVAWELPAGTGGAMDLRVVGVDGRCVKSWPAKAVPRGPLRILWDALDDRGIPVAAGRYYLIATDGSENIASGPVTIVR